MVSLNADFVAGILKGLEPDNMEYKMHTSYLTRTGARYLDIVVRALHPMKIIAELEICCATLDTITAAVGTMCGQICDHAAKYPDAPESDMLKQFARDLMAMAVEVRKVYGTAA